MHCTWFNQNKTKQKKVNFPYIFCGLFPLLIRPHISRPHRPSPVPHNTTWERSAPLPHPGPPGGPRPSWPAASDLARGVCPANSQRRQPDCLRPTEEAHAAGQGPSR